jgi:hypothetical protein
LHAFWRKDEEGQPSRVVHSRALAGQGLTLVASGREPHYDATDGTVITASSGSVRVTAGSADELVDRFLAASYAVRDNEFYEQDLQ